MHRSGTSWVSEVLSTGGRYIVKDEEIFLPNYPSKEKPIKIWYEYITSKTEDRYMNYIKGVLSNKYNFINNISISSSKNEYLKAFQFKAESIKRRFLYNSNPLIIAEPLGLLSAEWFAKTFNCKMIIMIRHPAAIISSMKINSIKYKFSKTSSILAQNNSIKDHMSFLKKQNFFIPESNDIIGQGILLWKILYNYVAKIEKIYPSWLFLRHEDLALNPNKEYKIIFDKLNLPFTKRTKNKINYLCSELNQNYLSPNEKDKNKRNSKSLVYRWHEILTNNEIDRIKTEVSDISNIWFKEDDWCRP